MFKLTIDQGGLYARGQNLNHYVENYYSRNIVQILPELKIRQVATSNCAWRAMVLTSEHLIRIGKAWSFEKAQGPKPGYITSEHFRPDQIKKIQVGGIGSNDVCMVLLHNGDLYSIGEACGYGEKGRDVADDDKGFGLVASNVEDVFVGGWHTQYITKDGRLFGFGFNQDYRCGVCSSETVRLPVEVEDMRNRAIMVANGCFSALLLKTGEVYSSGGTRREPRYTIVDGFSHTAKIVAGVYNFMALSRQGKIKTDQDSVNKQLETLNSKDIVDIGIAGPYEFAVMVWE